MDDSNKDVKFRALQLIWIKLCVLFVKVFYITLKHRDLRYYLIRKGIEKEFAELINLTRLHKLF